MEKYIEIAGHKLKVNPKPKLFTPENSPLVKQKVEEANELLLRVGLPNIKFIIEKR